MREEAKTSLVDFNFDLPEEQIAQFPSPEREDARLLCVDRQRGSTEQASMRDFAEKLQAEDLLVVNATRVLPARLRGHKESGGKAEALLLGPAAAGGEWRALVSCRGRLRVGQRFRFASPLVAEVTGLSETGEVRLAFSGLAPGTTPYAYGETPLPPYIRGGRANEEDRDRYQTLFARVPGAVAAPTAGLHFGPTLLAQLDARGIERAEVLLHVGVGTFRPLRREQIVEGTLHEEEFVLPPETAGAVARARERGGRVVAVGTTTARVLESCVDPDGSLRPGSGTTRLFLRPGSRFQVVDALLTNFHLPRSSLLLLVAAFAGRELTLRAYREAVAAGYRFYSYGDAMWLF